MIKNNKNALITTEDVISGEVMNIPLSAEERLEYKERTRHILECFQSITVKSLEMWGDLKFIKEHRLYREDYNTFQDYCRDELGKDNSQVYRLIKDAELKEELLLEAGSDEERLSIMSLKEGNTRFLRKFPAEVQLPIWKIVFGVGITVLQKKEDGSIEPTTGFIESVCDNIDEIMTTGHVSLNGESIPLDKAKMAADAAGTDEETVKAALLTLGVSEDYFEKLERQKDHIKEKSAKADIVSIKGTIESRLDMNGSEYPVLVDSKGQEIDLNDIILSFNLRWVNLSVKAPIRD
jgi:hypothetical protein